MLMIMIMMMGDYKDDHDDDDDNDDSNGVEEGDMSKFYYSVTRKLSYNV